MSTTTLYRLSAWCLIGSFVLSLAGGLAHPVVDGDAHSVDSLLAGRTPGAQYLIYAGAVLLMLGLPGGYLFLRDRVGRLGFVGFAGYMLGNALSAMSHLVVEGFVAPTVAADPDGRHLIGENSEIIDATPFVTLQVVGGLVFVLSMILIAIALLRAPGFPRPVAALLLLGALALMTPIPEHAVLSGVLVEVPRGLTVATLGLLILRRARPGETAPDSLASTDPTAVRSS
ncbi:hypothetical protein [Nocardioides sp. R-C-SC26]|uniref:hypothetical protein n=1 Tax=Nocardioides sp. R-C-SC26 TaxID=2870414 RepID=UPI001E47E8BD|nr:hypothetical protein [Nocardioides sp. R-C-SC26]